MTGKAVVIVSGGMDSTVLTYWARHEGFTVSLVSFDYGQRHKRELIYASLLAKRLQVPHHIVDLTSITDLLRASDSSLVSDAPVPEGHYSAATMAKTVVPNRNAIMLSIAYGHAVAIGATKVLTGVHAGDHAVYPDCRPEFITSLTSALQLGNEGFGRPEILAPFVFLTKSDIATYGMILNVPFELTWSCYNGRDKHCGRCGTCVERLEALHMAGVEDKTEYEDAEFWKQAVGFPVTGKAVEATQ